MAYIKWLGMCLYWSLSLRESASVVVLLSLCVRERGREHESAQSVHQKERAAAYAFYCPSLRLFASTAAPLAFHLFIAARQWCCHVVALSSQLAVRSSQHAARSSCLFSFLFSFRFRTLSRSFSVLVSVSVAAAASALGLWPFFSSN